VKQFEDTFGVTAAAPVAVAAALDPVSVKVSEVSTRGPSMGRCST
jgi:ribosomal protein L7/L12